MPDRPDLIIFDIGNVIINVDHGAIAAGLAKASTQRTTHDHAQFMERYKTASASLFVDFDIGKISPQTFYEEMSARLQLEIDFTSFVEAWNSCFTENPEVSSLVTRLCDRYRLFLLSNTNILHFEHLKTAYPVFKYPERLILSYEVRMKKPDRAIYAHALRLSGARPERVWYVDDVPQFVETALQLGINAIQFQATGQILDVFQPLLTHVSPR